MRQRKTPVKEAKDGQTDKLRSQIRNLQKENKRLKSELNAYDQAFRKTKEFLVDNTKEISVVDLISAAKSNKTLKQVKHDYEHDCSKCNQGTRTLHTLPFGKLFICSHCGDRSIEHNKEEE